MTEGPQPPCVQVVTTVDDREIAQTIAERLVRERLAACVQILGPVSSTYWWQGEIERAEEWLCLIKTTQDRYREVERRTRELHPYDVPEILAFPVVDGSADYLDWLAEQLTSGPAL